MLIVKTFKWIHLSSNTCLNNQTLRRGEPKRVEMAWSRACWFPLLSSEIHIHIQGTWSRGSRRKGFIKGIRRRNFFFWGVAEGNDDHSDIKGIQNRSKEGKCLLVHSEEINRHSCWDFSNEVPVAVVTSPCVFWLPSHIPVCLDGREPTHKPDLFIMGTFLRFRVSGKLCLPIVSCKHLFYGDFLQKNLLEST